MSHIVADNVWKEYGDNVVLEGVNLQVERHAFCTMVGASGCGKTTFLRMLLGTEQPTRGQLLIDGKPAPTEPGADRGIVFQRYSVFPHLSVLDNLIIGLELERAPLSGRLFGTARRKAREEAREMLHKVGLDSARDRYPSALSGGMQQRLAIAQSLIKRPTILLLDEPFGALDPGIRADMQEMLLDLWSESEMTVFMITHDIKEGFELGTRLLAFDKVRHDPQAPGRYGAAITYDLPLEHPQESKRAKIEADARESERFADQTLKGVGDK